MLRPAALVALVAGGLTLALASAAQAGPEEEAMRAAESWLALIDGGHWGESWSETAALFQGAISKDQWIQQVAAVRGPIGSLRSRTLIGAQYAEALPGAPDGRYVVIQYDAVFPHKKAAIETVTPMYEDGVWKVAGYYIK